MDSADSDAHNQDSLCQALASQGALVGQYDKVLRDVIETAGPLHQRFPAQSSSGSGLLSPFCLCLCLPHPQQSHRLILQQRRPLHPHPPGSPSFLPQNADLGACGQFLLQCNLMFQQQPATYYSDKSRIAFITSLLRGKASQWASPLWERESSICDFFRFCFRNERVF